MQLLKVLFGIFQLGFALCMEDICSVEDIQTCGTCTNIVCEMRKDNFIGSIADCPSSQECQEWCRKRNEIIQDDCRYVTYFGQDGMPVQDMCYLFSSCGKKIQSNNSITETFDCLCSSSIMPKMESTNLLHEMVGTYNFGETVQAEM